MSIIDNLKNFFSKILNKPNKIKSLPVKNLEENAIEELNSIEKSNLSNISDTNNFRGELKKTTPELSQEQIKEKFIKECILPKLDSKFSKRSIVYEEIYRIFTSFYGFQFSNLLIDKFDRYLDLIHIDDKGSSINFRDDWKAKSGTIKFEIDEDSQLESTFLIMTHTSTIRDSDERTQRSKC